jgi:hypothetical protein
MLQSLAVTAEGKRHTLSKRMTAISGIGVAFAISSNMLLDQYLDVEKLEEYVKAGYILRKQNESGNLTILNYSNKTTFDQLWDDVTCQNSRTHLRDGERQNHRPSARKVF